MELPLLISILGCKGFLIGLFIIVFIIVLIGGWVRIGVGIVVVVIIMQVSLGVGCC